ncbi:hypothetical protein DL89DRAFT_298129 [Linderina pennispora]|uniref:Uncharacterized protein n=1 Tax=Linderina pennispora TaxID=61395 RepID=A0A1Y1VRT0_9FUNG|nr:uncharacterized protein DL89DRAFT_298129 [Linderina pennispora]ORX63736.1 hypothetical protein DL89DRAFT_298129 [Linderina pennispora]
MNNSRHSFTISAPQQHSQQAITSPTAATHPPIQKSWHTRFRAQCKDRLSKAREASFMANRLTRPKELTDQEMYEIVRQEWARFKSEMEKQSDSSGFDEAEMAAEIEEVARQERERQQQQEAEEFEMYEEMLAEEMMMDEDEDGLTDADLQYLIDMDIGTDVSMDAT